MQATYTVTQQIKTSRGPRITHLSFDVSIEADGKNIKFSGSYWCAGTEKTVSGDAKFVKQYVTAGQTYRVYKFGKANILVRA
jgi:hypothetical protein